MSIVSKIDGTVCKNLLGLSFHLKNHGLSVLEYHIKYENFEIPKCKFCDKDAEHKKGITFKRVCGSKDCFSKQFRVKLSEEAKNKIRVKRLKYLSRKTGETAWERRSAGKLSYLEQWFFDKCIEYDLHKNFDIVNEYSVFPYSIDFAFVNEKVAVELDGKCHFVNGKTRIESDIKKDKHLIQNGWRVFRIRFDELSESKIDELLLFIGKNELKNFDDEIYRYSVFNKKLKTKPCSNKKIGIKFHPNTKLKTKPCSNIKCDKLHTNKKYCSRKCYETSITSESRINTRKVIRPPYDVLIKDTQELGFVKTGKKYGVSDNAVRKWIRRYEKSMK